MRLSAGEGERLRARARASEREKVHSGQACRKSLSRTTPGGNETASLRGWGTLDEEPFRFSFRSSTVVALMWSVQVCVCVCVCVCAYTVVAVMWFVQYKVCIGVANVLLM